MIIVVILIIVIIIIILLVERWMARMLAARPAWSCNSNISNNM